METRIRTFIALKLAADVIEQAAQIQSAISARGLRLRWVKPHNLHLTLKFLGDIRPEDVPGVGLALNRATEQTTSIALTTQGLGFFPGIRKPRVFWIGLGGQIDRLHCLHARIEDQLQSIGFARDKRGFKAHLTLARFRENIPEKELVQMIEALGNFDPIAFTADHLIFYKSDLKPRGAVYTPLAEFLLADEPKNDTL